MIDQENSDDEKNDAADAAPNSIASQLSVLIDLLNQKVPIIQEVLDPEQNVSYKIRSSITDEEFVPLGMQKLNTVEVVLKML